MKRVDVQQMMQARALHLEDIGLDPNELREWLKNYSNLKSRAKRYGRECHLTFEEYTQLAVDAELTHASQVGIDPDSYQLGRVQDEGHYIIGNCRFITKTRNLEERWLFAKGRKN